ncbi:MAG: TIGR03663 family protein [Oligoflexia bacterium]|nr:TIGR03663 family protein [Oligoflexia bacterium]
MGFANHSDHCDHCDHIDHTERTNYSDTNHRESFTHYFTRNQWIIFIVIIVAGLLLRWLNLDARPLHHDEALYSTYADYAFSDPNNKFYRYNPLLHGPMLFESVALAFNVLGANNWSGRAVMAFLGSLLMLAPFLFRRFFHPRMLLLLIAVWALSPSLIYWSRFVQQDYHTLTAICIMAIGAWLVRERYRSLVIILGIALHACIKLNVYITLALLLGYISFEYLYLNFLYYYRVKWSKRLSKLGPASGAGPASSGVTTALSDTLQNIKRYPWTLLIALLVGVFVYSYLYSAGFRYPKGILDGLYRESFPYWLNQHNVERIKGPYLYNFLFLSWYDFLLIVAFFVHLVHFYIKKVCWRYQIVMAAALLFSLLLYHAYQLGILELGFIFSFFKLKFALDAFGPVCFAIHGILLTVYHLNKGERRFAFWGFMMMGNFFTYSYVGEKVPWLSLYIFVPLSVYLALYFQQLFLVGAIKYNRNFVFFQRYSLERLLLYSAIGTIILAVIFYLEMDVQFSPQIEWWAMLGLLLLLSWSAFRVYRLKYDGNFNPTFNLPLVAFVIFILFNLRIAIITNFSRAGLESEFICQVHTTSVFDNIAKQIRFEMRNPYRGERPLLLTNGASIWPMTWFMRDLRPFYVFNQFANINKKVFHYVIEDGFNNDPEFKRTHFVQYIPLRHWWVPEYEKMNLFKYLNYAYDHIPWNRPGAMFVTFAKKKDY